MVTRLKLISVAFIVLLQPSVLLAQASEPERAFLDESRSTFSTKGHPKAEGVSFTIAYPSSWAASEAEGPNIVQKFVSEGGRGLEVAMIIIQELPLPPGTVLTNEDLKELLSPSELRGTMPDGATFVDAQMTEMAGIPVGILEYTVRRNQGDVTLLFHTWALNLISGSAVVQIQFHVVGSATEVRDVGRRMTRFKPLFTEMAQSIEFDDKLGDPSAASVGGRETQQLSSSRPEDDDPRLHILGLVFSFIVTWGIGLTPPLLIRYAFLRRSLSTTAASWVAGAFSVLFWLAFRFIHIAYGEKAGIGVVWILVFFVARWIMSRGYSQGSETSDGSASAEA